MAMAMAMVKVMGMDRHGLVAFDRKTMVTLISITNCLPGIFTISSSVI